MRTIIQTAVLLTLSLTLYCVFGQNGPLYPFRDTTLQWDERVDDLVNRLSLEEIVPQTLAIYGSHTPAIDRLGIKPYVWITECLHGQANTNTTAFPQAIGLAASFSNELIYFMAQAISLEVRAHWNANRAQGIYTTMNGLSCFSPVINIMRHPLWGRNQETYGEDPYLSGRLVQGYVEGLQGNHERYIRANAGCKHFDVHGGPENIPVSRFSFDAKVSMRDWRMTFLPQFKMCVDAGTYSLMCSYNSIRGVPACADAELLTDITRKEWGFKGYIVSDAGAVSNIISAHKYLNNTVDTAAASIKAGCNLELGSTVFNSQLDALKQGKLTEKQLRDNIRPLMYTRMRLGEFDPEDMNPYNKINMSVVQSERHRELATLAATMTFVLLKNDDNLLPLTKKYNKVAVVGPMSDNVEQIFGDYASNTVRQYTTTVYEGLSKLGSSPVQASGCSDTPCTDYKAADITSAVTGAELVIVALGLGQKLESEGNDRASLDLPGSQLQLLKDAVESAAGAPVILLLFNAGPLDVSWAKMSPKVNAIMACFYPAQSTGEALFMTLTNTGLSTGPAGRLPATWPTSLSQVPGITNYTMEGRTYRYFNGDPLYPFGYGLSYSTFHYMNVTASPSSITEGQDVKVTVMVENTGKIDTEEVVQIYMVWPKNSLNITVPKIQLAGFQLVFIKAGQSSTITHTILSEHIAVWMDEGFGFIPGVMTLCAGGQQPNQKTNVGSNIVKTFFKVVRKNSHSKPKFRFPVRNNRNRFTKL